MFKNKVASLSASNRMSVGKRLDGSGRRRGRGGGGIGKVLPQYTHATYIGAGSDMDGKDTTAMMDRKSSLIDETSPLSPKTTMSGAVLGGGGSRPQSQIVCYNHQYQSDHLKHATKWKRNSHGSIYTLESNKSNKNSMMMMMMMERPCYVSLNMSSEFVDDEEEDDFGFFGRIPSPPPQPPHSPPPETLLEYDGNDSDDDQDVGKDDPFHETQIEIARLSPSSQTTIIRYPSSTFSLSPTSTTTTTPTTTTQETHLRNPKKNHHKKSPALLSDLDRHLNQPPSEAAQTFVDIRHLHPNIKINNNNNNNNKNLTRIINHDDIRLSISTSQRSSIHSLSSDRSSILPIDVNATNISNNYNYNNYNYNYNNNNNNNYNNNNNSFAFQSVTFMEPPAADTMLDTPITSISETFESLDIPNDVSSTIQQKRQEQEQQQHGSYEDQRKGVNNNDGGSAKKSGAAVGWEAMMPEYVKVMLKGMEDWEEREVPEAVEKL
jgi:hypothetical protein